MTDSNPVWDDDWMASQKNFWDAWSRILSQSMEPSPSSQTFKVPWTAALDLWAKTAAPATPAAGEDFFQSIVRQGKTFLRLGEELTKLTRNLAEGAQAGANWKDVFAAKLNELKAGFTHGSASDVNSTLRGLLPFFELPTDTWSRMFSSSSLLPGDFLWSVKSLGGVAGQVHERMDQFLSIPAVGYMREWQEQTQGGMRLAMDYQKALQEYLHAHGRLGVDALERLAAKIIERAEQGGEINTLREVYDLWVDCGEEAYSAFVFTEEYADVYARLVNALMALKHHNQATVDEVAGSLNLPTHQGITTVQRRQQEFRRELAGFRSQLDPSVMEGMQARLKAQAKALNGPTQKELRTQGESIEVLREKVTVLERDVTRLLKELAAPRNGTGRAGRGGRIPAKKAASAVSVVAAAGRPRPKQAARASTAQKRGKGE